MLRKYTITSFVALSIAATPLATTAAMAKDNVDRFLMGLVTIGIASAIANEVSNNEKQWRIERPSPVFDLHKTDPNKKKRHRHDDVVHHHDYKGHHHHKYIGSQHVHHKHRKPRTCLRQRWTNEGWIKFYSKRCLRQHGY